MHQIIFFSAIISICLAHGYYGIPQPHNLGYNVKDQFGEHYKDESGTGGISVTGSYGYRDNSGLFRRVNYVADQGGFRAQVKTNEPGTASQDPAATRVISSAHPYFGAHGFGFSGNMHGVGYGKAYGGGFTGRGYDQEWEKFAGRLGAWSGHSGYGYGGKGSFGNVF